MSDAPLIGAVVRHGHESERGVVQAIAMNHFGDGAFHLLVLLPTMRLRSWRFDEVQIERVVRSDDEPPPVLKIGEEYDLEVRLRAYVTDKHDGHGLAYHVELTDSHDRGYQETRGLDLDADEVLRASRR